jgi:ABC-2 type transport system permease protein
MSIYAQYIAFITLLRKEVGRVFRIWSQTLLPPVITTLLYFVVFGTFLGSRIGDISGVSYIAFIVPGLVMMGVIGAAYANVSSSYFGAKFQKQIEEMIVSPMPSYIVVAGYVAGGVVRGMIVGIIILGISLFFTPIHIYSISTLLVVVFLASILFSLAGLINGVYAKNFDAVSIVPTFVITPMTYLGGVFYSISSLPPIWQTLSHFNPILYIVDAFRYGFFGISDIHIGYSISLIVCIFVVLCTWAIWLFHTGK